jgi:hypothetical protein
MTDVPAFGLAKCGKCGVAKARWAYYFSADGKRGVCGRHAPPKAVRRKLPHDLAAEQAVRDRHTATVEAAALANQRKGVPGDLLCSKLRMMQRPEQREGYLLVFPNFKHQGRKDGLGIRALSPKAIGPVHHGQPGLPPAATIENFHQGSKWFRGKSREAFEAMREQMYLDPVPHRHNPHAAPGPGGNKNVPMCSVGVSADGVEHKVSYVESRQFYCWFYSRAVEKMPEFKMLQRNLASGVNMIICGYDGYQPDDARIEAHYADPSRPFGHELVLYTMLKFPKDQWPWLLPKYNTHRKPE